MIRRTCSRLTVGLVAVAASVGVVGVQPALGATFTVSNTADSGPGSLRQALVDAGAAGADTVVIPAGLGTITLASTLQVPDQTTIDGNANTVSYAAGTAFNSGGTASYALSDIVIAADTAANTLNGSLAISDATLNVSDLGANTMDGDLTVTNSTITSAENGLNTSGGALTVTDTTISAGTGGVNAFDGAVTITRSSITFGSGEGVNTMSGAITVTSSTLRGTSDGGGVNSSTGSITITDSELVSGGTGVQSSEGDITIVRSSILDNDDDSSFGVRGSAGTARLVNTTVTGWPELGVSAPEVVLVYATVVDNGMGEEEGDGANIEAGELGTFGSVLTSVGVADCDVETVISNGYNYSDDDTCGLTATGDTQNGAAPGLGALAANGGPARTLLPASNSPLVDAIPTAACQDDGATGITTDERSLPRPAGAGCDIGAVELQPAEPNPTTPTTATVPPVATDPVLTPRFTG
jgi:hypothetical protein